MEYKLGFVFFRIKSDNSMQVCLIQVFNTKILYEQVVFHNV